MRLAQRAVKWPVFSLTSNRLVSHLVDQGFTPTLVVDVGANRGQFAVAVLELIPTAKVLSFEPLPSQSAELTKLCARYGARLEVRNMALGRARGRLGLHVNKHHQSSSLRSLSQRHLNAFPDASTVATILVEVDRLDSQLSAMEIPRGSMLKLDVQGFERDVVEGANEILMSFDTLVIEASFQPLYDGEWTFVEMVDHLASRGFKFLRPAGFLQDPSNGEYLQIDAIFVRSSVQ